MQRQGGQSQSYAARSAQAYENFNKTNHSPPPVHQQQQPPPPPQPQFLYQNPPPVAQNFGYNTNTNVGASTMPNVPPPVPSVNAQPVPYPQFPGNNVNSFPSPTYNPQPQPQPHPQHQQQGYLSSQPQYFPQQQKQQQQQQQVPQPYNQQQSIPSSPLPPNFMPSPMHAPPAPTRILPGVSIEQQILNDAIRRMQESIHIMRGAMEANDLATTLDRASAMLGELGDPKHHAHHHAHHHNPKEPQAVSSPKHYYELHMMALEELPNLEEYLLQLSMGGMAGAGFALKAQFTMKELYDIVQYCPRAVPRLYLQICAGSALMRSIMSGDTSQEVDGVSIKSVLLDLQESVKCVQCPIRGLFLRHYMLQAVKDKLPDDVPLRKDLGVKRSESPSKDSVAVDETLIASKPTDDVNKLEAAQHNRELQHLMEDLGIDVQKNDMEKEDLLEHNEKKNALMGDLGVPKSDSNALFEDIGLDDVPPLPECPPPPLPPSVIEANGESGVSGERAGNEMDTGSGSVKDSYEFVLSNFIEMNKLWVRIQHLPGDSKSKDVKMRRERERNELRMMVGTNLVRISELEGVTSAMYGTVILPKILDQIVACHDPLAQAYLMDCIIQVFPDEFHIQTLEVVLSVCPKLREKVNVRTILQSIMDRLANYYADELLLNDEKDTEGVKSSVMLDSFHIFHECILSVLKARGMKLTARETIRLQSALLDFCLKCYPGRKDLIDHCLGTCASALRGDIAVGTVNPESGNIVPTPVPMTLDDTATRELEKMLSLPLEELSLRVLGLSNYSVLLSLLPGESSKTIAVSLLETLDSSGERLTDITELDQLFSIMSPLIRENTGNTNSMILLTKVMHLIYNENTDVHFELLFKAKHHLAAGGNFSSFIPLFYTSLRLLDRVKVLEFPKPETNESEKVQIEEEVEAVDVQKVSTTASSLNDSIDGEIEAAQSSEYFSSEDEIIPEESIETTSTLAKISSPSALFDDTPLPEDSSTLHESNAPIPSRQIT
jgi:hypothetical protein